MQPMSAVPATAFAAFRRLVIEEPAAFARLQAESDPDAFAGRAVLCGAERGLRFCAEDVKAALQMARSAGPESTASAAGLAGWTPVRLFWANGEPQVEWCRLGSTSFTEPFFEQTVSRALRNPAQRLFRRRTPAAALEELGDSGLGLAPTGFIFHESRCGSTLVAQMLAALAQNIVVAEAPPLDQVLLAHLRDSRVIRSQRLAWFRGMVAALGQRRRGDERNYFIKFDCWHALELPLIREAFPDVPWIFLYREPVEVLVSHERQRGPQMIPGLLDPRVFGIDFCSVGEMSLNEYGARALARIRAAALSQVQRGGGRLVNFTQLPGALWESPGATFGIDWTPEDVARMRDTSRANAKTPCLVHVDDRAEKQRAATAEIRRLADLWLGAIHARLEAARVASAETRSARETAALPALAR